MLRQLVFICLLFKASAANINGQGSTAVDYGEDADFGCVISDPEGVQQVTWQRSAEPIENLATYSKKFGQQVNEPYRDKVFFSEASLSSTSITVKNVTWEDESCYICSFNGFPDGSTRKQICLTVKGISEVKTAHVVTNKGKENKDVEVMFSCSATGKPAPTIEWPGNDASAVQSTTTVTNRDGTFTSSSNITLQISPVWDGHMECLLNSGMKRERRERILFTKHKTITDHNSGVPLSSSVVAPVVIVLIFIFAIVVAVILRQKRLKGNRRNADVTQEEGFAFQQTT